MSIELKLPSVLIELEPFEEDLIHKISGSKDEEFFLHLNSAIEIFNIRKAPIDVGHWICVLTKIDIILNEVCANEFIEESRYSDLICIFSFLKKLLDVGFNKRYFLSFKTVESILSKSNDIKLIDLICETISSFCTFKLSCSEIMEHDNEWHDTTEIPKYLATFFICIFDSLNFTSPEYSIVEFLRGHDPLNIKGNLISINLYGEDNKSIDISIDAEFNPSSFKAQNKDYPIQFFSISNALTALKALPKDRVQIVCIRLKCLDVILRSKINGFAFERIQQYFQYDSILLNDLILLSDPSSDTFIEFSYSIPNILEISKLAVSNLVLLCEASTNRRNLLSHIHIQEMMGISSSNDSTQSNDCLWQSILLSWFSMIGSIKDTPNFDELDQKLEISRIIFAFFKLALFKRETSNSIIISTSVGAIINLLNTLIDSLKESISATHNLMDVRDSVIDTISKGLRCLNCCFDIARSNSVVAFREYHGLDIIENLFKIYSDHTPDFSISSSSMILHLLNGSLSLLIDSISSNKQGNLSSRESGIFFLTEDSFVNLSKHFLTNDKAINTHHTCAYIVEIYLEAIDIEPQFLSQFLDHEISNVIGSYIVSKDNFSALRRKVNYSENNFFSLISDFVKLLIITERGQNYLIKYGIHLHLIEATRHPFNLQPISEGINGETLVKIGRSVGSILRSNNELRQSVIEICKMILLSITSELQSVEILSIPSNDFHSNSLSSQKFQLLQQLNNICLIIENINNEARRSDVLKEILDEHALDSLFKCYIYTLPTDKTLLVQLGKQFCTTNTHVGYTSTANSISNLLKTATTIIPQLILPILFKVVDQTLCNISAYKVNLITETPTDAFNIEEEDVNLPMIHSKSRSRSSSLGQSGINVYVLGLLECFPNCTIFSSSYNTYRDTEKESFFFKLIASCLFLEWLILIMTFCFRPGNRHQNLGIITSNKDILRRLFAFYQSSLLEVSRFYAESKWKNMSISEDKVVCSRSHPYHFEKEEDNYDDIQKRIPKGFKIRVTNKTGALIRDGISIEGSRVVLLAPVGTEVIAFERRCMVQGKIIRYRTAHGWLSECRRDHKREPIVELLDLIYDDDTTFTERLRLDSVDLEKSDYLYVGMMTVRETASFAFERIQMVVKQLVMNLARLIILDSSSRSRIFSSNLNRNIDLSEIAPIVTSILSKMMLGSIENSITSLSKSSINFICEQDISKHFSENSTVLNCNKARASRVQDTKDTKINKNNNEKMTQLAPDENQESLKIEASAFCLYYSFLIKQIFTPLLKDRNNHYNTYLIFYLQKQGILNKLMDSIYIIISFAKNGLPVSVNESTSKVHILSSCTRCALHAIPILIDFSKQLFDLDAIMKAPITLQMNNFEDAKFKTYEFLYYLFHSLASEILNIHKGKYMNCLHPEIIIRWLDLVGNLQLAIQTPLPQPANESSSTPSTFARNSHISRDSLQQSNHQEPANYFFNTNIDEDTEAAPNSFLEQSIDSLTSDLMSFGFDRNQIDTAMSRIASRDVEEVVDYLLQYDDIPDNQIFSAALVNQNDQDRQHLLQDPDESINLSENDVKEKDNLIRSDGSIKNSPTNNFKLTPIAQDIENKNKNLISLNNQFTDNYIPTILFLCNKTNNYWIHGGNFSEISLYAIDHYIKFLKPNSNFDFRSFLSYIIDNLQITSISSVEGYIYLLSNVFTSKYLKDLLSIFNKTICHQIVDKVLLILNNKISSEYPGIYAPSIFFLNLLITFYHPSSEKYMESINSLGTVEFETVDQKQFFIVNTMSNSIIDSYLVETKKVMDIYSLVSNLLTNKLLDSASILQFSLNLLTSILLREDISDSFASDDTFPNILDIDLKESISDSRALISLLFKMYIQSSNAKDLSIYQTLKQIFNGRKFLKISDFLDKASPIICQNPSHFRTLAPKFIRFIKGNDSEPSFVYLTNATVPDWKDIEKHISFAINLIINHISKNKTNAIFSTSDCLNCLVDNIITNKAVGFLFIKNHQHSVNEKNDNFFDFLFQKIFPYENFTNEADAAARLFLILCSCGSESRQIIYTYVIFYLKWYFQQDNLEINQKLLAVSRLLRFTLCEIKKSNNNPQNLVIIKQLHKYDLYSCLFECLDNIFELDSSLIYDGILSILEQLTRPSIVLEVQKLQEETKTNKNELDNFNKLISEGIESSVSNDLYSNRVGQNSSIILNDYVENQMDQNLNIRHPDQNEFINEDEDEEDEDDGSADGADGAADGADDADAESLEGSEETVEEDEYLSLQDQLIEDNDDNYDINFNENDFVNRYGSELFERSTEQNENPSSSQNMSNINLYTPSLFESFVSNNLIDDDDRIMNRGEAASNSIFITPPDQIQRDPLQSLLNQLSQDEDFPVEHLTDLYYRPVQRPVRNFNMNSEYDSRALNQNSRNSSDILNNLERLLHISTPRPLSINVSNNNVPDQISPTVDMNSTRLPSNLWHAARMPSVTYVTTVGTGTGMGMGSGSEFAMNRPNMNRDVSRLLPPRYRYPSNLESNPDNQVPSDTADLNLLNNQNYINIRRDNLLALVSNSYIQNLMEDPDISSETNKPIDQVNIDKLYDQSEIIEEAQAHPDQETNAISSVVINDTEPNDEVNINCVIYDESNNTIEEVINDSEENQENHIDIDTTNHEEKAIESELTSEPNNNLSPGSLESVSPSVPSESIQIPNNFAQLDQSSPQTNNTIVCPDGYDSEVFYSLPDFMQLEISEQYNNQLHSSELIDIPGIDPATLAELPEDIRLELIEQNRREAAAVTSTNVNSNSNNPSNEIDSSAFLLSLPEEVRADILLTFDENLLSSLPAELQAEAQAIRERAAAEWQEREIEVAADSNIVQPNSSQSLNRRNNNNNWLQQFDPEAQAQAHLESYQNQNANHTGQIQTNTMLISKDDFSDKYYPIKISEFIISSLSKNKLNVSKKILYQLLLNVSKNTKNRDFIIKVLVKLILNKDIEKIMLTHGCNSKYFKTQMILNQSELSNVNFSKRLINALKNVSISNSSVLYDFLRPRNPVDEMSFNSYSDDYEFSINLFKDLNTSKSSNSLFEILLEKYSMKNFQNTFDILDLSILIDLLVKPFDNFDEETYFNQVIDENPREKSMDVVRIPYLVLKREPLKAITEIFIHENCNREIFNHLTSIISRLSKINHNRLLLIEILSDIIVELSTISFSRLSKLLSSLENMKTNSTEKRTLNSSSVLSKINDFGGQIHEKFLNTLKTFKSLAIKSNSDFIDIIPTKEISPLWKVLDSILLSLHIYLEDDTESSDEISIYSKKETTHTSLVLLFIKLLPMIEAFLIIYASEIKEKELSSTENAATLSSSTSSPGEKHRRSANYNKFNLSLSLSLSSQQSSPPQEVNALLARSISFQKSKSAFLNNLNSHSTILYQFVSSHSRILNSLINYKPTLLEDTLSPLMNVIQLRPFLSFENKKNYFYSTIKKSKGLRSRRSINLNIRRDEVFENSFNQLRMKTTEELRSRLVITFNGEEGIDAGGLTREWYQILSKEIFNPNYVLFLPTVDGSTFQPNPLSYYNSNHLDYFKFVGRIIGKALVDGQMMDAHFTRSLYKHLLGIPVDFSDIEAIDPEYYKSLNQILNYPLETLGLELYFTAESLTFGKHEVVELKKNGTKILVDDSNKLEYVNLISQHRMTNAIRSQIELFLDGFYDLVPPELISIFSPSEVELLICGLPDVDIEDLRLNTEYHQYRPSDQIIGCFWDCLRSFNREEKAAFLQFVTGSSKIPLGGFSCLQGMRGTQKFSIHKMHGDNNRLPTAHTCFNQLDLPEYSTYDDLRMKLLVAIKEGSEGFGFA